MTLARLARALPVDLENHVVSGGENLQHRLARRAVAMVEDAGVLEEGVRVDH